MNNTNFTTNEARFFVPFVGVLFSLLMSVVKRIQKQLAFRADSTHESSMKSDLHKSSQIAFKNSSLDEQLFATDTREKSVRVFTSIDAMISASSCTSNITSIRSTYSLAVALKIVLNDVATEMTQFVSSLLLVFTSLISPVLNPRCTNNGKVVLTSNGNKFLSIIAGFCHE